jgi:hypothetical protein
LTLKVLAERHDRIAGAAGTEPLRNQPRSRP